MVWTISGRISFVKIQHSSFRQDGNIPLRWSALLNTTPCGMSYNIKVDTKFQCLLILCTVNMKFKDARTQKNCTEEEHGGEKDMLLLLFTDAMQAPSCAAVAAEIA